MVYYITYSNEAYSLAKNLNIEMALKKGRVDKAKAYGPNDIDEDFFKSNVKLLTADTGNGYWLWKPYFILKTLESVNEGDIVLYCDAASFLIRDCRIFLQSMKDDIWVSNIALIEKEYTKPELFEYMKCNEENYLETNQFNTIIYYEKSLAFCRAF